jgi:thiol-disulfide isomerase/thioredoxin
VPHLIRWLAGGAVVAIATSVVLAQHTSPRAVSNAAASEERPVVSATDLPVLKAGPLPSVSGASGWLNTPPLDDDSLRGKVVLVDFWTFACVNCQHTLSHVKAWQQRYAKDGLLLLSVHSPEFDYEADPDNVADYVTKQAITYPVALDPDHRVWSAWGNHYWPAFYLYDRAGQLRLRHFGEGAYDSTEDAIRAVLGVDPSSPRAVVGA